MQKERNYEEDLRVDQYALDEEWAKQPALFMSYAEMLTDAKDRMRRAEEKVKVIRSSLVMSANERPDDVLGKGVKPTVPVVEAYYRGHQEHQDAKEEWLVACREVDDLETAVVAFKQRKDALENLVRLQGQSYYSTPTAPENATTEVKERLHERQRENERTDVVDRVRSRRAQRGEG